MPEINMLTKEDKVMIINRMLSSLESENTWNDFKRRLSSSDVDAWSDIKSFLTVLSINILEYASESNLLKKRDRGLILYGLFEIYDFIRPVLKPLIKNLIIRSSVDISKSTNTTYKPKNRDAKDLVSSFKQNKLGTPAGDITFKLVGIVDSLDEGIVRTRDAAENRRYKKRANLLKKQIRARTYSGIGKDIQDNQEDDYLDNLVSFNKFNMLNSSLHQELVSVCNSLQKINKKDSKYFTKNGKKILADLELFISSDTYNATLEESEKFVYECIDKLCQISDDRFEAIKNEREIKKQDKEFFALMKSSLSNIEKIYQVYEPTTEKYKFFAGLGKYAYLYSYSVANLAGILDIFNINILNLADDLSSEFIKPALKAINIDAPSSQALSFLYSVAKSTAKDLVHSEISSFKEDFVKDYSYISKISKPSLTHVRKLKKIEDDISKSKITPSKFGKIFGNLSERILKEEVDSYKNLMDKTIGAFIDDINKINVVNVEIEEDKSIEILDDVVDMLSAIRTSIHGLSTLDDADYIKKINEFNEYIITNQKHFNQLEKQQAINLLESWYKFSVRTAFVAKLTKNNIKNKQLDLLHIIEVYAVRALRSADQKAIDIKVNIDNIKKNFNDLGDNVTDAIERIDNILADLRVKVEGSSHSKHFKNLFYLADTASVTFIKSFQLVGYILNPILKVALPTLGFVVGGFGSSLVWDLVKGLIPGGMVLSCADILIKPSGSFLGESIGGFGYSIFSIFNNKAQKLGSKYGYNEDLLLKLDKWCENTFPKLSSFNNWYKHQYSKTEDSYVLKDKDDRSIIKLDVYQSIRDVKQSSINLSKKIKKNITTVLIEQYKNDPSKQQEYKDLVEIEKHLDYVIKHINKDNKDSFSESLKQLELAQSKINLFLNVKISKDDINSDLDFVNLDDNSDLKDQISDELNESEKLQKFAEYYSNALSHKSGFDNEIAVFELGVYLADFVCAKDKFINDMDLIDNNPEYDSLKKEISDYIGNKKEIFRHLKNIEIAVLRTLVTVNYVLIPVAKFILPPLCGVPAFIGATIAGAAADTATGGASLGFISLVSGAMAYTLTTLAVKVATDVYDKTNKQVFKKRLLLLEKEMAVWSSYESFISNKVDIEEVRARNNQQRNVF